MGRGALKTGKPEFVNGHKTVCAVRIRNFFTHPFLYYENLAVGSDDALRVFCLYNLSRMKVTKKTETELTLFFGSSFVYPDVRASFDEYRKYYSSLRVAQSRFQDDRGYLKQMSLLQVNFQGESYNPW